MSQISQEIGTAIVMFLVGVVTNFTYNKTSNTFKKIDKLEGSFTINSNIFKFAIGLTWADFVNSHQYNSDGEFTFGVGYSIDWAGDQIVDDYMNPVLQTHAIINGYSYNI